MIKRYFILTVLISLLISATAQDKTHNAYPAQKGIFVFTGNDIINQSKPVDGATAYKIERRIVNLGDWDELDQISAPDNISSFKKVLKKTSKIYPKYIVEEFVNVNELWERAMKNPTVDSLGLMITFIPLRVALGTMYLDKKVKNGFEYEYRISVNRNNSWETTMVSTPVTFNPDTVAIDLTLKESRMYTGYMNMVVEFSPRNMIAFVETFRRQNLQGNFTKVFPQLGYQFKDNNLILRVQDYDVQESSLYEYTFKAYDYFGNQFFINDTIYSKTFDQSTLVIPYNLKATGAKAKKGIKISWQMKNTELISNIRLYRSELIDGEFERIANLPSTDSTYFDDQVKPMTKYWYYLQLEDLTGETSFESAKFLGIYKTNNSPEPVQYVFAKIENEKIVINWSKGIDAAGYYVYRADNENAYHPLSNYLTDTVFVDNIKQMKKGLSYRYAIQTENSSYQKSELSTPASVFIENDEAPKAPAGLQLVSEPDHIRLIWYAQHTVDYNVAGYYIYRRLQGTSEWIQLSNEMIAVNQYRDSTVLNGQSFEYTVRSVSPNGLLSPVTYTVMTNTAYKGKYLGPPASVKAVAEKELIRISWTKSNQDKVVGYKIYKKEYKGKFKLLANIENTGITEFEDNNVKKGMLYIYEVVLINSEGQESKQPAKEAVWF